jgi:uncharacterized protein YaaN involved in tellurite resistance
MFIYLSKENAEVLESFFDEYVGENRGNVEFDGSVSETNEELCDLMNEIRTQIQENRNSGREDENSIYHISEDIDPSLRFKKVHHK